MVRRRRGQVATAITDYLHGREQGATLAEIQAAVEAKLGQVAPSSVRAYLNTNVGKVVDRLELGRYRLRSR